MKQFEPLWRQAKADLTIQTEQNLHDTFVWEHAERVAHLAQGIQALVSPTVGGVDLEVLLSTALYYASGWVVAYQEGVLGRSEILSKPITDLQRELSAVKAAESLKSIVSDRRLKQVCNSIREAGRRDTTDVTAKIVVEAANLDQIGPLSIWQLIRRQYEEGRGVKAALKTWNRQKEYNFWHARIKDTFRFEAVARIAYHRLQEMENFIAALEYHGSAEDLKQALPSEGPARSGLPLGASPVG